ncbi:MAG TPA: hypothetical protein VN702_00490 [Acetobacteraceae bacterium]|nr:hypothetical protein [Acetobacteraceae bacterium]
MILTGTGPRWEIEAAALHDHRAVGTRPYIPCIPAIVLARRLVKGEVRHRGATPCVDLIDLDAYLAALEGLDISVIRDLPDA